MLTATEIQFRLTERLYPSLRRLLVLHAEDMRLRPVPFCYTLTVSDSLTGVVPVAPVAVNVQVVVAVIITSLARTVPMLLKPEIEADLVITSTPSKPHSYGDRSRLECISG